MVRTFGRRRLDEKTLVRQMLAPCKNVARLQKARVTWPNVTCDLPSAKDGRSHVGSRQKRAHGPHDDKSKTARFGREERTHRAHAPEAGTFLGAASHLPSVMPAEHASNRACARYERRIISVTMAATWAA